MAQEMAKTIERLNDLIALDIDAVNAYESAVERVDVPYIAERLREFQQDHERHVRELSDVVRRMGGEPRRKPDVKGFLLKGFTTITSMMGTEAALKAMQGNETLTNRTYSEALREDWPADVRTIIARNHADEQRHLRFIEQCLQERAWEQAPTVQP